MRRDERRFDVRRDCRLCCACDSATDIDLRVQLRGPRPAGLQTAGRGLPSSSIFHGSRVPVPSISGHHMTHTDFTPFASLAGGALIGLAAVLLMGAQGRIAGISGIASRLFPPFTDDQLAGRWAFIAGLVLAPLVWLLATGRLPLPTISASWPVLILAGLAVGFGTVLGSG
eukprot:gene27133-29922_t